ncbi:predicted permease [Longilinea arvoryzae]|uniref:Predicted permease n=2 Tax=Longilinea arvoryzae TaxID=360412 RepID=A0A0S7BF31_9CHLR|nr:predicted permease [Longilinea arvoryzae]
MWATLIIVFVAFCFWLLYRFYQVVFIFFIAIVLGTVIRPIVNWLQRKGLPRIAGILVVFFLVFAALTGFVLLLFPLIFEQGSTITTALPGYYQSLREWMMLNPNPLIARLSEFLPAVLPSLVPTQQSGQQMLILAGQAAGYISMAANAIFIATAILLLVYHWALDGQRTIQSLLLFVPKGRRESVNQLITDISTKVSFYVAGQAVLCLTIGILALIAYLLIGLPNALLLALVAGVLEAVPMIGPLLGAIPASVIALSIAPSKLVWVIIATLVIQQMENILLVPRVMRKAVGVNPFVSLLSIFAFSSLFGIAGALMAIPIAAIIQLLLDRFVFHPVAVEPEISTDRDYASRLRYEAQDLAQDLRRQARITKWGSDLRVKQIDQVMDEIEAITTDLDALLAQVRPPEAP